MSKDTDEKKRYIPNEENKNNIDMYSQNANEMLNIDFPDNYDQGITNNFASGDDGDE